jgi:hypothetical protein
MNRDDLSDEMRKITENTVAATMTNTIFLDNPFNKKKGRSINGKVVSFVTTESPHKTPNINEYL